MLEFPAMNRDEAKPHILVVEDARDIREPLARYIREHGYRATTAPDAAAARKVMKASAIDLVVLDIMMPGEDGLSLCRSIRETSQTPVILLTARGEEVDRIVGLEMGADDYLPKTFSSRELLARLRAVTRRTARPAAPGADRVEEEIVVGPLRINPNSRVALLHGEPLTLTALEFELLSSLARSRGRVKTREQLIETIADRNYDGLDRSIDVHIWSIRKKLGDDPKNPAFIRTVRAVGYMLINPDDV